MEEKIKKMKIKVKLGKFWLKLLTFWLSCATLISEYTGIAVYFAGQKSYTPWGKEAQQNKKQKRTTSAKISRSGQTQLRAGRQMTSGGSSIYATKAAQLYNGTSPWGTFATFCFLRKRLFVSQRSALYKNKDKNNKTEHYDSRLLSTPRHSAGDRPQQNNRHSLGRGRTDSQSAPRQSRLALLQSSAGRRNYSIGSRHRLFPQWPQRSQEPTRNSRFTFSWSVRLLGVLNCATYVWSYHQQHSYYSLEKYTKNILAKFLVS